MAVNGGFLVLLVFYTVCFRGTLSGEKCRYIDYRGRNSSKDATNCTLSKICQKTFKMSYIHFPPYSTAHLLEGMMQKCCGKCTKMQRVADYLNVTSISFKAIDSSDFILPFIGKSSAKTLYGYYFIPIVDVPTMFYITPKYTTIMEDLISKCTQLYPIVILCLLMALISGFIVWSAETWVDKTQFPRSFIPGVFEGFWYSIVSMTTVGYGDRIVKSVPARLFSVLWILIGIIMFGLLTSLFTAEIMHTREPHNPSMEGAKVGALQFRDYDATSIVKQGGIVRETNYKDSNVNNKTPAWNFYSDILFLIRDMRDKEISGFVIDKYTLAYVTDYFRWKENNIDYLIVKNKSRGETYEERKDDIEFFRNNIYRTENKYEGEKLSYGVLVKHKDDYEYFRHAFQDNRLSFETDVGSVMNEHFPKGEPHDIFSPSNIYFKRTIKVLAGILGFIFVFGILFEVRRKVISRRYNMKQSLLESSKILLGDRPNQDDEVNSRSNDAKV